VQRVVETHDRYVFFGMAAIRLACSARHLFRSRSRVSQAPPVSRQLATISAAQVKELREATGAPILQCKVALQQPDIEGDFDAAVRWLREQGMGKAAKKASRHASEGLVAVRVNAGQNEAVLVEVRLLHLRHTCFINASIDFAAEFRDRFCRSQ
jgi:hypothetical protein